MSAQLINKLTYKENTTALVLNMPEDVTLDDLTYDTELSQGTYEFILSFVKTINELNEIAPKLVKHATDQSILWLAYPKKSGEIKTDLSRDKGWDILGSVGYRGVSQVAINDNWTALRIRPTKQVKSNPRSKHQVFEAIIEGQNGSAWIHMPFDVEETFGTKGQVKVKALFDGHPYRGSLANMGNGHILIVKKDIRKAINKQPGDTVQVELQRDTEERILLIPEGLQALLNSNTQLQSFFDSLSYTNRKEYAQWVGDAKREETRLKRLSETERRLLAGIKNPFEK